MTSRSCSSPSRRASSAGVRTSRSRIDWVEIATAHWPLRPCRAGPLPQIASAMLSQNEPKRPAGPLSAAVADGLAFGIDARDPTAHAHGTRAGERIMPTTRRRLLSTAGSFALTVAGTRLAGAAMGPNDKFDLVVKGGDVLDPSQSLRGRRDIGIRYGIIEALEADIPA